MPRKRPSMPLKIYVGNLSNTTTETALADRFAPFGIVEDVRIFRDLSTGQSLGYGYVEMADTTEGQAAIEKLDGTEVEGYTLTIRVSHPPWRRQSIRGHLLKAPPFLACEGTCLWDTRSTPYVAFACKGRPQLVTTLVQALEQYFEREDMAKAPPSPQTLQQMQNNLWDLSCFFLGVKELKQKRLLSKPAQQQTKNVQVDLLLEDVKNFVLILDSWTSKDTITLTRHLLGARHYGSRLAQEMWEAFEADGPPPPPRKQRGFSTIARLHAIATILTHFDIEKTEVATIVSRLKKARQRRLQSP